MKQLLTGIAFVLIGSVVSSAQTRPSCPTPGTATIAWHSIARQARTYALFQLPRGITQGEAQRIATTCRFGSKVGYLVELPSLSEWQDVQSRFGNSLRGKAGIEHIWVGAGTDRNDGYVKWFISKNKIRFKEWRLWAPGEPGSYSDDDAVTFHAEYPGLFNACHARDKYTRLMVEFR